MFKVGEIKTKARACLRRHYILFIFLCLMASVIGAEYTSSYSNLSMKIHEIASPVDRNADPSGADAATGDGYHIEQWQLNGALAGILMDKAQSREVADELVKGAEEKPTGHIGDVTIGHTRGVLASVVNKVSSGAFFITIMASMASVLGSAKASMIIFVIMAFALAFIVWMFLINAFRAVYSRMFLEGRIYEKVPARRMIYLLYVRKWHNAAFTLFLQVLYQSLWAITIIGGLIKSFSYFAVPYIVAENPGIKANEAITLSRKMMDGHKMECFKLRLSFIGWDFLEVITFGLSGILWSNPYLEASRAEFYSRVREEAVKNKVDGFEKLNDVYLFERPSKEEIEKTYGSLEDYAVTAKIPTAGLKNRLGNLLGVCISDKDSREYMAYQEEELKYKSVKNIIAGKEYGYRFLPFPVKERVNGLDYLHYDRFYSINSVVLMFAIFSILGWVWEVTLHLMQYGNFVNRGILHGPWIPIYGAGGVLALLLLNKLRSNPVAEFCATIVLCGIVEYFTGWLMETTHGGESWWTYEGYFMNINGRVCAEGLLAFGIGGMILIYLVAPLMDNLIHLLPTKIITVICIVFVVVFSCDAAFSAVDPNSGEGITSKVEIITEEVLLT